MGGTHPNSVNPSPNSDLDSDSDPDSKTQPSARSHPFSDPRGRILRSRTSLWSVGLGGTPYRARRHPLTPLDYARFLSIDR